MMDLEKLKALADAATPGPWRVRQDGSASWLCQPDQSGLELKDSAIRLPMKRSHDDRERNRLDALFIAAAREAVPALIAEVERLRVESARLTRLAGHARNVWAAVGEVLAANGCECECGCHIDEHADDCERCLGCRVEMAMRSATSGAVIVEGGA